MKQLVVLVGLPGSGKTAYHAKQANWVVVSKDTIRQSVFRHSYDPVFEESVDRIFSSTLIEAVESSAEVVCVDDLNLLRKERKAYIELGQMTGRQTTAVVMPYAPVDEIFQLVQHQLAELETNSPRPKIAVFPRDRFDAMLRCYEAVKPEEGFSRIIHEEQLPIVSGITKPDVTVHKKAKRREEKQHPIPLFAS